MIMMMMMMMEMSTRMIMIMMIDLYCVVIFRALLQTSQLLNWFILDQKRQELVSTGVAGPR